MDDDDDGENINDEDGELGKTLSFIKCKPSLVKSNNSIQPNDRSASMTHQGFSTNNIKPNTAKNMSAINSRIRNASNSHMNGSNTEFDSYLETYHDKYLYDLLNRYERTLLGTNALASSMQDEHLFIDINI